MVILLTSKSVPAPVIQSKSQNQRQLHRLLYEARPTRSTQQAADVLEFEMVLPLATVNEDGVPEFAKAKLSPLEDTLFTAEASKLERPLDNICRIGYRSTVDLMLPDRLVSSLYLISNLYRPPTVQWTSVSRFLTRPSSLEHCGQQRCRNIIRTCHFCMLQLFLELMCGHEPLPID